MKKTYIFTGLLLSLFFCVNVFGQEKKAAKADKEFENFRYIDARKAYLSVVDKGYTSQNIFERLGDSYYFNAELPEASQWYGRLYTDFKASMKPEYYFRYSQTLKSMSRYEEADQVMIEFDKATSKGERRVQLFKEERNYLQLIELQSGRFNINSLPINASGSDFGPSFYKDDQIVFASSREEGGTKIIHEWNEAPFLDLYTTKRQSKESMSVQGMERIKGKVNTQFHESSTVFTKDGNTMYFTRNNLIKKKSKTDSKGIILLKLYKATKKDGKWKNIQELPFNSDEYSVAHPALSNDEKKLYFASNMPGSEGLSDLYVVDIKSDNTYGEPKNLGKEINTEARETFPFISKTGMLFFASDGHIGLGGLDVFVTKPKDDLAFSEPFNVGRPINSPQDDFTFIVDDATKIGFFTSNRPGGMGDDDIYSFIQTKDLILECNQYLNGTITDAETRKTLSGAKVTLFSENMKELESTISGVEGEYNLPINCNEKYVIRASKDGYAFTEVDFASTNDFEFKHNEPIQLRSGNPELGIVKAGIGDDLGKLLQLQPIYFDFDKSFIRADAEIELQKVIAIMSEYPTMIIDVRSHTDCRAPKKYNENLSERRNKSTLKYLITKGKIDKSRLTGRGYGEQVLTNKCAEGVECSEEEHQLNRRSEFIILKQ